MDLSRSEGLRARIDDYIYGNLSLIVQDNLLEVLKILRSLGYEVKTPVRDDEE